ncbi:type I secretion system permease/ATPase [Sphingomonas hengshuiensis]|uniref:type I secretion system permease/ATPase n=1 Tax=Sphingomonas hengshuiensis TaxID=1609977 RepID=UPI000981B25C|nr:type I secretion system permease/ATPase [Sphingomonas hengshuiensis]
MASVPGGQSTDLKPLARLLRDTRHSFYIVFALSTVLEILKLAPIIYMWNVMDRAISSRSAVTLGSLAMLVVGVYVFWGALDWLRSRLLVRISLRIDWDLASEVFDASFRRAVGRQHVNVQQLLGDLVTLRQFITGEPILALIGVPHAIIFIIVGFLFHPLLAVFIACAVVVMLISTYATEKVSGPILRRANEENAEASRLAQSSLRQSEATLALGMLPAVRKRWYERHRNYLQSSVNASESTGLTGGVSKFLSRALPSMQLTLGAYLAINGEITGGMVIAASMLISRAVSPIQRVMARWKDIIAARQSYAHLNQLLADRRVIADRMQLPAPTGRLDVQAVTAVPPGASRPVVAEVNFHIEPGQAVAIIGPSGSGKTSLTRLLIGIWAPQAGTVRLDGVDLAEWDHEEVGPYVGYVPQEIDLHEATVAENIARLGDVDPEKVVDAATLIGMHETILGFPNGYDTMLGETGFALSGGQRQRIAIARALYGDPKYVVMDEPNASLDEIGEGALVKAIMTMKARGTSFAITTHRPRLMTVADNLLVLRQGLQVGFGPTAEIIGAVRNLQIGKPEDAKSDRDERGGEPHLRAVPLPAGALKQKAS